MNSVAESLTDQQGFTLQHIYGVDEKFEDIKAFRATFDFDTLEDETDRNSRHYYVEEQGRILFTVRITRWIETIPDISIVYPFRPTEDELPHVATASMFLSRAGFSRTLAFTKQVWVNEIAGGIRADLILVQPKLESYYIRLGYRHIDSDPVTHPRTGNVCTPMALVCDSDIRGGYADVCGLVESGPLGARLKKAMRAKV